MKDCEIMNEQRLYQPKRATASGKSGLTSTVGPALSERPARVRRERRLFFFETNDGKEKKKKKRKKRNDLRNKSIKGV